MTVYGGSVSQGAGSKDELTYDVWAEFLAAFFFDEAHAGEEILFAVDELSLAEASDLDEEAASASLAAAVRLVIGSSWNVGAIHRLVDRWRKHGSCGAHPALPFLALTVLAASRMGSYEGYAAHKFYVPLRRALVSDDPGVDAPGAYLDYVDGLWRDLARWANEDLGGSRGRLTIRDPGWQYGRGLAMQHALVKSSDLRHLDAFFRRIGLRPGEAVAPGELRRALRAWTARRTEPWARRLARVSSDDEMASYAEALLFREAQRWDGRPRDPRTGKAVGHLRLGLSSVHRPLLGLCAQWDERLPESVKVSIPSGYVIALSRSRGWYEPHPIGDLDVGKALSSGLTIRGGGHRFDLRAEDVYALSYDDDLGAWVSADSMSFGDRYHLIVSAQAANDVLSFVQAESTSDAALAERASRALPAGWKLITDVRIDARPRASPPEALRALVPAGAGPRLQLFGGLPLDVARGAYLRGGEPVVVLSSVSDDDVVAIRQVDTDHVEGFRASDRELELWRLGLPPGSYEIANGVSRVTLQIVDGIAEAAGPGAGSVAHHGRGGAEIVGTSVSTKSRLDGPIMVPAPRPGESLVLLGARPSEHHVVAVPLWLTRYAGPLSWQMIDAWPDFDPVWSLMRGSSGRFEASMVSEIEPAVTDDATGTQWGRFINLARLRGGEDDQAAALWDRYRLAVKARP